MAAVRILLKTERLNAQLPRPVMGSAARLYPNRATWLGDLAQRLQPPAREQMKAPNDLPETVRAMSLEDLFSDADSNARKLHGGPLLAAIGCVATPVWHS